MDMRFIILSNSLGMLHIYFIDVAVVKNTFSIFLLFPNQYDHHVGKLRPTHFSCT